MSDAKTPIPEPRARNRAKRLITILLIGFTLWLIAACGLQRQVLFPRWAMPNDPAIEPADDVEMLTLDTDAGPVQAWFIPGKGQSLESPAPVVIFAHGNAERIEDWDPAMRGYTRMGVGVMLPEFRGYGNAAGSPSEDAIVADFVAFYDRIVERPDVDPSRIVIHGRSVGGGVAAQLAARRPSAALVLQSSFTSAARVARGYSVPRVLMRDPFDVEPVLREYGQPVLLMHGRLDAVIPPSHAEANHAAAPDSRLIWYDIGHNDPPPARQYWSDLESFLREAGVVE